MALLSEQVPEHDRKFVGRVVDADIFGALDEALPGLAQLGDARQIALDVGGKNRNPGTGKALCEDLQGHGLAGAGGAGHEPVTYAFLLAMSWRR